MVLSALNIIGKWQYFQCHAYNQKKTFVRFYLVSNNIIRLLLPERLIVSLRLVILSLLKFLGIFDLYVDSTFYFYYELNVIYLT